MKTVSVYTSKGYREYINHWISAQESVRGILSQMCKAMNCQNAHLTRVLSEKVHLTMDQAFRICEFIKYEDSARFNFKNSQIRNA